MASSFNRPGLVVESFPPPVDAAFRTGVAGFVGPAVAGLPPVPPGPPLPSLPQTLLFTSWPDFADTFRGGNGWRPGIWLPGELLWAAVQGFFANGGTRCWVVLYDTNASADPLAAVDIGVTALAAIDDVDLVCAPSLLDSDSLTAQQQLRLQQQLIWSAENRGRDGWFLILDAPRPPAGTLTVEAQLAAQLPALRDDPTFTTLGGTVYHMQRPNNAAVYYPWLVPGGDVEPAPGAVATSIPASGHVAGTFARTDLQVGVHKAPANEPIDGIVDVLVDVDGVATANPIRAYPGRGIRVWGARTLAVVASPGDLDAYVGVRRLMVTLDRWLVHAFEPMVFEANEVRTWVRIHRELNRRLTAMFEQGAFQGSTPDEAFYVKCDDENNPVEARTAGRLQVDIGVAPAVPKEFIKIRLVRSAEGITVA